MLGRKREYKGFRDAESGANPPVATKAAVATAWQLGRNEWRGAGREPVVAQNVWEADNAAAHPENTATIAQGAWDIVVMPHLIQRQ